MAVAAVIALGISGVLCLGAKCENSVKLTPSPEAIAGEGETLYMQCDYTGLSYPDYINWYLNGDTFGLVIDARHNQIQAQPNGYETERYATSCNATSFSLSIANVSQAKDGGDKWECDVTIIDVQPPSKASTVVKIKTADKYDDKSGRKFETNNLVKVISGILGGLVTLTIAAGYVIYRIKKRDVINGYAMNYWSVLQIFRELCTHKDMNRGHIHTTKSDMSDHLMPLKEICLRENQRIPMEAESPLSNQALLKNLPERCNELA